MDIYTLIAVASGWLLNELSQFLRRRRENRMILNQAWFTVMTMVFVLRQKGLILASIANYSELTILGQRIAKTVLVDEHTDTNAFREKLMQSVDTVARYDPFIAMDLRSIIDLASTITDKDILAGTNEISEELPLELISKSVQVFSSAIEKLLFKIVFRTNFRLWFQLHYRKWKDRKDDNKNVADSVWPDIFSNLRRK
jgi:hypothetical protein